jgi:hypothetical protein
MANLSRITVTAHAPAVAYLAAEGLYRKQLAARYTIACTDPAVSKTAFKYAAEAIAQRQAQAELPFLIEPADLEAGMRSLGFDDAVAAEAVRQVVVTYGIRAAAEQHSDAYAAEILQSHLLANPYLAGIATIRPTHDVKAEPVLSPKQRREAAGITGSENPVGRLGELPFLDAPNTDDGEVLS